MVGHKLGEFSPTRQFHGHTPADKKAAQEAAVTRAKPGVAPAAAKPEATPAAGKPSPNKPKVGVK
jgi:hypothetical protein